jgi:hypothetical protein
MPFSMLDDTSHAEHCAGCRRLVYRCDDELADLKSYAGAPIGGLALRSSDWHRPTRVVGVLTLRRGVTLDDDALPRLQRSSSGSACGACSTGSKHSSTVAGARMAVVRIRRRPGDLISPR